MHYGFDHVRVLLASEKCIISGGDNDIFPTSLLPSKNSCSSFTVSRTVESFSLHRHENRPCSRRFANTHRPVPSQYSTFARIKLRLTNKNSSPLSGFRPSFCSTTAISPSNPLRMSTGSVYAYAFTRRVVHIIAATPTSERRHLVPVLRFDSHPVSPALPAASSLPRRSRPRPLPAEVSSSFRDSIHASTGSATNRSPRAPMQPSPHSRPPAPAP